MTPLQVPPLEGRGRGRVRYRILRIPHPIPLPQGEREPKVFLAGPGALAVCWQVNDPLSVGTLPDHVFVLP